MGKYNHSKMTRISKPIKRISTALHPKSGKPLVFRIDHNGLTLWVKGSMKKQFINFTTIWEMIQQRARQARKLNQDRKRIAMQREWGRYFLSIRNDGYGPQEIAVFLATQGILHPSGKPWLQQTISQYCQRELDRIALRLKREEAYEKQKRTKDARGSGDSGPENPSVPSVPGIQEVQDHRGQIEDNSHPP